MYHAVARHRFGISALGDITKGSFRIEYKIEYLGHLNHFDISLHSSIFLFFWFLHKVEPFSVSPSSECWETNKR